MSKTRKYRSQVMSGNKVCDAPVLQNLKHDFSAIIFDMDGLVLDTEKTYCIAWQQASAEMGNNFTEEFCISMSGLHYQDVEKRLLDACGIDFDLKLFNRLSGDYWHQHVNQYGIPVKKGFYNVLAKLNTLKIPFCLATNSRLVNALECLALAGLEDVFSIIITRDDVKQGKPSPDIFLFAAEALTTPVSQCLVVEDSHAGIQAAVQAGAISVFIPSVFPIDLITVDLANYYLNDLDELTQIIHL